MGEKKSADAGLLLREHLEPDGGSVSEECLRSLLGLEMKPGLREPVLGNSAGLAVQESHELDRAGQITALKTKPLKGRKALKS